MPLSVEIKINGSNIETVWIARIDPLAGMHEIHTYIVGVGTRSTPPWASTMGDPLPQFPRFVHRYSDGARVCVMLALTALSEWERTRNEEMEPRDS